MGLVVIVLLVVACWVLNSRRNAASTEASAAKQSADLATRERDQLRGELGVASERLRKAASAEAALTKHIAERDDALAQLRVLQNRLDAASNAPSSSTTQVAALEHELAERRETLAQLQHQIGALSDYAELQSFGLYRPHYAFDAPESYRTALEENRGRQSEMIKEGRAVLSSRQWAVDGSVQKGQQMLARQTKLMLRAFNGECDAAIAKVRFNNVVSLEERLGNACNAINKLAETYQCSISEDFLTLKVAELRLAYEHAVKQNEVREEQRRVREQMREEEAVRREMEEQQRAAELEEERAATALKEAQLRLLAADQKEKHALAAKIEELQARLVEAHASAERAVSMAQLTRAGHVYVISNEGSFGESVYKVGMTRRRDPMERVYELGDASVPFAFDVHAMIYSEDAPELERKLHQALTKARVNLVNVRKEFFAVTLDEIENALRQCHGETVELTRLAVADEWRQSKLLRAAQVGNDNRGGPPAPISVVSSTPETNANLSASSMKR